MKTSAFIIRICIIISILFAGISCDNQASSQVVQDPQPQQQKKRTIRIALLLDTSNSMDGLIDQAKSQLWRLVNELSKAECESEKASIEIALYEYGNDGLPASEGHIRQVSAFTTDLDKISADLFALTTNGGNEFCGQVIQTSLSQLQWNESGKDLQIIFIAGNEPFTQGLVDYRKAGEQARQNNVIVNTIFCGDFNEGVRTSWKDGAVITGGEYMSINHNSKTVYIKTPYDDKITKLNSQLNETYIPYGRKGAQYKQNQQVQDQNASQISKENMVSRAVTKSKHVYKNKKWDLVDAADDKSFSISNVEEEVLPDEMKGMDSAEKQKYVKQKKEEREAIKAEIEKLGQQREEFIAEEKKKSAETDNMLDEGMLGAVKKQAVKKSYVFK